MRSVLITGANRGLGFALAQLYSRDGRQVIATVRDAQDAAELRGLGPHVRIEALDLLDDASIDAFLGRLEDTALDIAVMNAGVPSRSFDHVADTTRAAWTDVVGVNTFAPFRLATALRDNLVAGQAGTLVAISCRAASIGSNTIPGRYAERASKAALNALWRSLSVEWRELGIACLLLDPGAMRTRLSDFRGDIDAGQAAQGVHDVIAASTLASSGTFVGYDGQTVPW